MPSPRPSPVSGRGGTARRCKLSAQPASGLSAKQSPVAQAVPSPACGRRCRRRMRARAAGASRFVAICHALTPTLYRKRETGNSEALQAVCAVCPLACVSKQSPIAQAVPSPACGKVPKAVEGTRRRRVRVRRDLSCPHPDPLPQAGEGERRRAASCLRGLLAILRHRVSRIAPAVPSPACGRRCRRRTRARAAGTPRFVAICHALTPTLSRKREKGNTGHAGTNPRRARPISEPISDFAPFELDAYPSRRQNAGSTFPRVAGDADATDPAEGRCRRHARRGGGR